MIYDWIHGVQVGNVDFDSYIRPILSSHFCRYHGMYVAAGK